MARSRKHPSLIAAKTGYIASENVILDYINDTKTPASLARASFVIHPYIQRASNK